MNTIEIPQIGKTIEYPSSWDECTPRQIRFIFRMAVSLLNGKMELQEFKVRVFYHLTCMKRRWRHERKERRMTDQDRNLKYENVYLCSETVGFMFEEKKENEYLFFYDYVMQMFPKFRCCGRRVYGPSDALFNITWGEYMVAADFCRAYVESKNEADLNKLCAVLYRPRRWRYRNTDDPRIPFNANECVRRSRWFRRMPFAYRFLIYSWFSACDNYFKTGNIQVDGQEISLRPLFKTAGTNTELGLKDLGLTGIAMSVAESGVFGSIAEVNQTKLYMVLMKLYQWHVEHKRLERQLKKKKHD